MKHTKHSQSFWEKRLKTINEQIEELKKEKDTIIKCYYKSISKEVLDVLRKEIKQQQNQ